MNKKLIVLSVDSLFDEDMEYLKTLPNFKKILDRGVYAEGGMRSVYPSFTYPAHASIITGTWPEYHGIYHNEKLDVGNPAPDWFWYHKDLKVPTILDLAHRNGLTTACIGWPCMGADPEIDWLVPEIWPENDKVDPRPILKTACSENMFGEGGVMERHWHKLRKTTQPFMDNMMVGCACDIIRRYKPDVMFIHLAHLDHTRHANGIQGPAVTQAIIANDDWLGRLMEATMDAGLYEETNFAVISDHGHLPVHKVFNPNVLLVEEGLISLDDNGKIVKWDAYCNSTSLSCQVVMKDPKDEEVRHKLEKLLYKMRVTPEYGVEAVFNKEEVRKEQHLAGEFEYVLEGQNTSFGNAWTGDVIVGPDNSDYKFSVASHGHLPVKGAQPVFMMAGPCVAGSKVIERQRIIDEAPTFAKLLGFEMPDAKGCVIEGILK
ncbi:MAG: ectonucleotide pyrophosphatase/phosphodiesterase [Eubacteriales bacterium]|nr:ectonucleotide pyrophosphatase/phosphodiesterase [Eubacteriales bacterium]